MAKYSDAQISNLIKELKILPENWLSKVQLKEGRTSKSRDFGVEGVNGHRFKIILRQSKINADNFSAILGCYPLNSNKLFNLKRYDGKDHAHTNSIEKQLFQYVYHIHTATERYQEAGDDEEKYAEVTDLYSNLANAFNCLLKDCNFQMPDKQQLTLIGWI